MVFRTISDERAIYRQICNFCKKVIEADLQLLVKFNGLDKQRKEFLYAKLVCLVAKELGLQITYYWYIHGVFPVVHKMAFESIQRTPLHGPKKQNQRLLTEVKDKVCLLAKLGIFDADSFLINFYHECAPANLRELYLAKEDLLRDPTNANFARFETEVTLLKNELRINQGIYETLLEFGMLYSSLTSVKFQERDWLMNYLKVISQYVAIYSMVGPRKDIEITKKKNQLPRDVTQLERTIESLKLKLRENAEALHRTITVDQNASELLS